MLSTHAECKKIGMKLHNKLKKKIYFANFKSKSFLYKFKIINTSFYSAKKYFIENKWSFTHKDLEYF